MNALRVGFSIGLAAFVILPLSTLVIDLLRPAAWQWTGGDTALYLHRALNTFALAFGAAAIAVPIGTATAVLLFRTSFFARRFFQLCLAAALFIPLPVYVMSFQAWCGSERTPITGLAPAIAIHALAAVPWVACIVGVGLTWVESELEEEAAQCVAPWRVVLFVTLCRARASIMAAGIFVVVQTAAEVAVAEMTMVPTLAETTRMLFAASDEEGLARTLTLSLPVLAISMLAVFGLALYGIDRLPPLMPSTQPLRDLGVANSGLRFVAATLLMATMLALLLSLLWKLGLAGHPPQWRPGTAWHFVQAEGRLFGATLAANLATSLLGGFLTAGAALVGCWLARDSAWLRWLLFGVLTAAWVLPGPIVGVGLQRLILVIPPGPWKNVLHHGPSPMPLIWVQVLRTLPIAVLFLWPAVRLIPRQAFEEAKFGGAGALSEFLHIVLPATWRSAVVTALACAALCLGEVGASTRVETPGWESFAKMLLNRIHFGVDNSLAAVSFLLLSSLAVLGLIWFTLSACVAPSER
ncbi:MAG: ABC transporter permease subunit [Planctomycetes bacterium]|nr:ABC transporter permease subunit [Planctomycetota bacterium]